MKSRSNLDRLEELVRANFSGNIFEEILKIILLCSEYEKDYLAARSDLELEDLIRKIDVKYNVLDKHSLDVPISLFRQIISDAYTRMQDYSSDFLDIYFESLIGKLEKSDKGQFFTPRNVVELCARISGVRKGYQVFDPSCGPGGFLTHIGEYIEDLGSKQLFGSDIDPRMVKLARINSVRRGMDIKLTVNNTISNPEYNEKFDLVIANPPFAGEVRERSVLETYTIAKKGKNKEERDILFIESIYNSLKLNGKMIIILPYSIFGASYHAYVREWILEHFDVIGVISLSRNTFLPFTHQKANILIARKGKRDTSNKRIFMSISEKSGKNGSGNWIFKVNKNSNPDLWEDVDHDLELVADGFERFICEEGIEW